MKKWVASSVLGLSALGLGLGWTFWPADLPSAPFGAIAPGAARPPDRAEARSVAQLLARATGPLAMPDAGVALVRGTVTDEGGAPVAGAEVEVLPASHAASIIGATCDECGAALLACQSPRVAAEVARAVRGGAGAPTPIATARTGAQGTFALPVQWEGDVVVRATDGRGREAWQSVQCDGEDQEVELALAAPRSVAGVVLGEDGEPIAGARVLLVATSDGRHAEVVADAQGSFRARCPSEPCALWSFAEAPGFAPLALDHGHVDPGGEPLELQLLKARALEVQTRLAGQLIDADVAVELQGHTMRLQARGGAAILEGLGSYDALVEAQARGFTSGQRGVALAAPRTVVRVELRASARVLVEVLDERGEPEPDVTVQLDGPDTSASAQTDERGSLVVLGPVGEGTYELSVQSLRGASSRREVDLAPGDNHLQVVLPPVLHLRGRLTGIDPEVAEPIAITAVAGQEVVREGAAPDGSFALPVSSAGPWELSAVSPSLGRAVLRATAPAEGLVLAFDRRAGLEVRVTAEGKPAPDVHVLIVPESPGGGGGRRVAPGRARLLRGVGRALTAVTDEQGVARLWGLEPGPLSLTATDAAFRPRHASTAVALGRLTQVELSLERGAEIEGLVVDAEGAPVTGADVHVRRAPRPGPEVDEGHSPELAHPRAIEERGRFTVSGLEPASGYVLSAATEDSASAEVVVQPPARGVRLQLSRLPRISGRVLDSAGAPVPVFEVEGTSFEAPDGRFEVAARAPGEVQTLFISAPGFEGRTVDVPWGKGAGDVVLQPAVLLEGQVVGARGEPVPGAQVTCDACTGTTTAADGRFALELDGAGFPFTLRASRGAASALAEVKGPGPLVVRLGPRTAVVGQSNDLEGRPAPGRVWARLIGAAAEPVAFLADGQGRFGGELAHGVWSFEQEAGELTRPVRVEGAQVQVTLGAGPNSCSLSVALPDEQRWQVYVLEGQDGPRGEGAPQPVALDEGTREGEVFTTHLRCGQATVLARSASSPAVLRFPLELKGGLTRFALPAAP